MKAVKWLAILATVMVTSSEKSESSLSDFREWYQSLSDDNVVMEVRNSNWGLGLFATKQIKKGDVVLRIPSEWVVSRENILKWYRNQHLPSTISTNELLIWWLVNERSKSSSSRFYVWLKMLPEKFSTPLQYSDAEVDLIEPEDMKSAVKKNRDDAKRSWAMLKSILDRDVDFEAYKWAKCILATRAWHMRGDEYLVPVAGMFNHDLDDDDHAYDWRKDTGERSQKFLTYHTLTSDGDAVVRSDRHVQPSDQVFESYGDNVNAIYFQYHGFVPDNNPYDCYKLNFQKHLQHSDAHHGRKLDYLKTSQFRTTTCLHHGELSSNLLLFSTVSSIKSSSKAKACLKYGTALPFKQLLKCSNNEIASIKFAIKMLSSELSSFRTSIEEDEEILQLGNDGVEHAIAKYRYKQKLIIRSIIEEAEDALSKARKRNDEKKQRNKERKRQAEDEQEEL
eukprot:TRINITY_DN4629_c0_g1_i1.p1 TRINITY_DN4629_c0_g1~~TRINITY_DN4629_c0_g1_i1.p1  ORF type:complete len:479 (+),score=69.27 TRINITY_DN4629_c0_g1_i1:90-1439(+)